MSFHILDVFAAAIELKTAENAGKNANFKNMKIFT